MQTISQKHCQGKFGVILQIGHFPLSTLVIRELPAETMQRILQ